MECDKRKTLYDDSIEFDISKLPTSIQEIILELERLSLDGDDFNYELKFPILEVFGKNAVLKGRISESDYKILIRKYGWLDD